MLRRMAASIAVTNCALGRDSVWIYCISTFRYLVLMVRQHFIQNQDPGRYGDYSKCQNILFSLTAIPSSHHLIPKQGSHNSLLSLGLHDIWLVCLHEDVIKWKHFPRYWLFVRGIHRSPVNSPHKGQWRGALMFSLICAWIRLSKQSCSWWFETPSRPLWRHYNMGGLWVRVGRGGVLVIDKRAQFILLGKVLKPDDIHFEHVKKLPLFSIHIVFPGRNVEAMII